MDGVDAGVGWLITLVLCLVICRIGQPSNSPMSSPHYGEISSTAQASSPIVGLIKGWGRSPVLTPSGAVQPHVHHEGQFYYIAHWGTGVACLIAAPGDSLPFALLISGQALPLTRSCRGEISLPPTLAYGRIGGKISHSYIFGTSPPTPCQ